MLKVQDGFSENNLKKHNLNNKTKLNLSFTGHKVIQNDKGENLYRFYLPALKEGDKASVQVVTLVKDDKGNYGYLGGKDPNKATIKEFEFKPGETYIDRHFELHGLPDDPKELANVALGYKFKINEKDYIDSTLLTPDRKWNIATPPNRPILEEARSMYHIMPDLMISKKTEKDNSAIYDARRTHFNKLGGNIDGIIEKIDYMRGLGVKRILSTPIFGQDNLSSHGYWTTNPYQITDGLGDISKFKKLNTELFKNGMGWIADGAFVNEGLEGVHTEHISKWGVQSPYIDWLNTFNFPDKPFKFGILSKKEDVNNANLGIKLINADYKIKQVKEKQEDGTEKLVEKLEKNKRDISKPTYIQIYDKRLASEDTVDSEGNIVEGQMNNDEIIRNYANKNPKDSNEVNDYMDSIIPYKFEIKPEEVSQKLDNWEESKKITAKEGKEEPPLRNFLTEWTNFATVPSDNDGGTTLWVGNKDISKLRFMLTEQDKTKIKTEYLQRGKTENEANNRIIRVEQSAYQVQDNIVQVGEFWTNEVAKTLHSHTAKQLAGAMDAESFVKKINEKAGKDLPSSALKVTKTQINNLLNGSYSLKTAPVAQSVAEGLMSYPLDAIEFNSGMSGILGSPFLKKLATSENQIGKSRYQMYEEQKKSDYKGVLDEFRTQYKDMDKLISSEMTDVAVEILQLADKDKKIFKDGELTEDGKELYSLVSNDMAKFICVSALAPEIKPNYKNSATLEYDNKKLADVSPQSLGINATNPENEAALTIDKLKSGIKAISPQDKEEFAKHLATRLSGLDAKTVKVAKLIVDKAEGGLEWRIDASKDVCPIEDIQEGNADFELNWNKGINFWKKFTDGIRKYNPRAYEILEVTDEETVVGAAAGKAKAGLGSELEKFKNRSEAYKKFILESGATTPTNYLYGYSTLHRLIGAFSEAAEKGHVADIMKPSDPTNSGEGLFQRLITGWANEGDPMRCYGWLESNPMDAILHSHNSLGNQDKPRVAHLGGLDADTFYNEGPNVAMKNALTWSFTEAFKNLNVSDEKVQNDISSAITRLADNKYYYKTPEGKIVEKQIREEEKNYFGKRPFDISINDVLKEARLISEKDDPEQKTLKYLKDEQNTQSIKNSTMKEMLNPALKRFQFGMALLVGLPGNPTIYHGDEVGETGWEDKNKNTYVQNRNLIHYTRLDSQKPDYIKEVDQSKKIIQDLMNLRKDERCSPLVDGFPVLVNDTRSNIAGLYRYNDKKDMFIFYTNNGFGPNRINGSTTGAKTSEIMIDREKSLKDPNPDSTNSIMNNILAGTKYVDALKNESNVYYQVDGGDCKYLKKYVDGQPVDNIEMKDPYLFLVRENNFDKTANNKKLAFSGNPQVKIANMKYNIPRK